MGTKAIFFRLLDYLFPWLMAHAPNLGMRLMLKRYGWFSFSGYEFFIDRQTLNKRRSLQEQLRKAEQIDALFVGGGTAYEDATETQRINRLILPDPASNSFRTFEGSLPGGRAVSDEIKKTTKTAYYSDTTEVRWCPEFIGYSFMIGDIKKESGWVHIELVLPYANRNERPSFTIYKSRQENFVLGLQDIFDELWKDSREPKPNDFED